MAVTPPITVPADFIGSLKCAPCTDQAITDDTTPGGVPAAWTLATIMQTFNINGQSIAAPCVVPVCYACRKQQLGMVSKAGLVTA